MIEQNRAVNATPMRIAITSNIHYVSLSELLCDKGKCSMTKGSKLFLQG